MKLGHDPSVFFSFGRWEMMSHTTYEESAARPN